MGWLSLDTRIRTFPAFDPEPSGGRERVGVQEWASQAIDTNKAKQISRAFLVIDSRTGKTP